MKKKKEESSVVEQVPQGTPELKHTALSVVQDSSGQWLLVEVKFDLERNVGEVSFVLPCASQIMASDEFKIRAVEKGLVS